MLCSAFAHIAVFSYDIRSFMHDVLILLVSLSILYMHVTRMIAILSSRRPECPFQFKASPGFEFEFKKRKKESRVSAPKGI